MDADRSPTNVRVVPDLGEELLIVIGRLEALLGSVAVYEIEDDVGLPAPLAEGKVTGRPPDRARRGGQPKDTNRGKKRGDSSSGPGDAEGIGARHDRSVSVRVSGAGSSPAQGRSQEAHREDWIMVQQTPDPSAAAEERRRLSGGAIAFLAGVGLLAIFVIQNRERVTLHFLFWDFTWPLWLFTLTTALIGALIWFGLGVMRRHRRRVARREARRE